MDTKLRRGAQILSVLTVVVIATAVAFNTLQSPTAGIDDANIFFVYARNISAGEGFVFNPGGERVEGFTSLLWVLLCTAAIAATRSPELPLLALNVLLVSVTIVCCLRSSLFRRGSDETPPPFLWSSAFVMLVVLDFRYVAWNTFTLMETSLWGALMTAATVLVLDDRDDRRAPWVLAGLVALMVATRPEALVFVPAICGLFFVRRAAVAGRTRARAALLPSVLAYGFTAGLLTIFRLAYFGWPLPNTYYAKVSPSLAFSASEGAKYLVAYVSSQPIPLACFVALVVSLAHLVNKRFRDSRTLCLTVMGLTGLLVPVLTGGDHFDGFRFYQPVYPVLLLVLFNCLRFIIAPHVTRRSGAFPATLRLMGTASLVAIVAAVQIVEATQFGSTPLRTEFEIATAGRRTGKTVNALFEELSPRPSVASITVGGFQYTYAGHVIDLMGLNNTNIAHNGGDRIGLRSHAAFEKRTFYELNPPILVPLVQYSGALAMAGGQGTFVDRALKGLLQDTRFRNTYRLADVRKSTPNGMVSLAAWYDREFLNALGRSGEFEIVVQASDE